VDREDLALLGPALDSFLAEFADVAIAPTRKLIAAYLRGQLGPLERKSVMPMAREAGIAPRTLQELLSLHRWDEDLLVDLLQGHVARAHTGGDTVATIHETWCPKKGDRTPGVDLQPCGSGGKTRNCVLLLHLGFSDDDFHCLLDSQIYLPRSWTDSPERRESARIPRGLNYRTRSQIALDMLDRAATNGLRPGWVSFGLDLGSDPQFLKDVAGRGYRFAVAKPSVRKNEPAVSRLTHWTTNAEGSSEVEPALKALRLGEESGRVFEDDRRRIGLDHFEVRSFTSLQRHLVLSSASILFVAERVRRLNLRKERSAIKTRA
jgi:hypothetical protein